MEEVIVNQNAKQERDDFTHDIELIMKMLVCGAVSWSIAFVGFIGVCLVVLINSF